MTNNIPRQTYVLDVPQTENVVPVSILTVRDNETGQVFLSTVSGDHREVERKELFYESFGCTVLLRLEGEHDLGTGEKSVWVRP